MRASCPPGKVLRVEVVVNGCTKNALIDTGCTFTLVSAAVSDRNLEPDDSIVLETMDRRRIRTLGSTHVASLVVGGRELGPAYSPKSVFVFRPWFPK